MNFTIMATITNLDPTNQAQQPQREIDRQTDSPLLQLPSSVISKITSLLNYLDTESLLSTCSLTHSNLRNNPLFIRTLMDDLSDRYAQQPISQITPDSFVTKVEEIALITRDPTFVEIEYSIRRAVKAAHDDLVTLSNEFLDASADNPHVGAARIALQAHLETLKKEMQDELHVLFAEQHIALAELIAAHTDFINKFNAEFNVTSTRPVSVLIQLDLSAKSELAAAKQKLIKANTSFEAKDKVAQGLHHRKVKLEDKLQRVNNGLVGAELDRVARAKTTNVGMFYLELNKTVSPNNAKAASFRMLGLTHN